jgi:hypothetical protein
MATVVLEDRYSDTASLIVAEGPEGGLNVGIQGRIGGDEPALAAAVMGLGTLEEMYLALHPDESVAPESIRTLSTEIEAQRARDLEGIVEAPLDEPAAVQDKDANAFFATACVPFNITNSERWKPMECTYKANTPFGGCISGAFSTGMASAGWNEQPRPALHCKNTNGSGFCYQVPAWTWHFNSWSGTFTNHDVCMQQSHTQTGNLGITRHVHEFIIR